MNSHDAECLDRVARTIEVLRGKWTAQILVGIDMDLGGIRGTLVSYRDQTMCTHAMAAIICTNLGSTWPPLRPRTRRLSDTRSAIS
jgi:hypothetical protein